MRPRFAASRAMTPTSARGKLALARVLLTEGDRDGAGRLAREAWRSDELSERMETEVLETFRDLLTRDDHRARMDKRIGAKDLAGAKRAAQRLGDDELAIVKACAAVRGKADKAKDALDDVAAEARAGSRLHALPDPVDARREPHRRCGPPDAGGARRRRWRCRTPINGGASGARSPASCSMRANSRPPTRWSAPPRRRPMNITAPTTISCAAGSPCATSTIPPPRRAHFARIDEGQANPIVLARANYWRGRAAEALGRQDAMRAEL